MAHKYLDEIEGYESLASEKVLESDDRKEKWLAQQKEYGFDDRDTWSLDTRMTELLYERLRRFVEIYEDTVVINKEFQTAYRRMLELAVIVLKEDGDDYLTAPASKELWALWAEWHPACWW